MTVTTRQLATTLLALFNMTPLRSALAEPWRIYAAGRLTAALPEMLTGFPAAAGDVAQPVFGPSAVLPTRIERGDRADLFASADMDQPRRLARSRAGSLVPMFTRNCLCALAKTSFGLTPVSLLDQLLDPSVRLATSTTGATTTRVTIEI